MPSALRGTPSQLDSVGDGADQLDLALLDQLERPFVRQQLRLAGPQHVGGCPPRLPAAKGIPRVRVGNVGIDLVDVIGEADQLPLLVVERDVEVVRVHQLADDGVHRPVELLQVLRRARELGDAVERGLHLLRVAPLGLEPSRARPAAAAPPRAPGRRRRRMSRSSNLRRRRGTVRQPEAVERPRESGDRFAAR